MVERSGQPGLHPGARRPRARFLACRFSCSAGVFVPPGLPETVERALRPRQPGPPETDFDFVSAQPGPAASAASTQPGPNANPAIQTCESRPRRVQRRQATRRPGPRARAALPIRRRASRPRRGLVPSAPDASSTYSTASRPRASVYAAYCLLPLHAGSHGPIALCSACGRKRLSDDILNCALDPPSQRYESRSESLPCHPCDR